MRVDFGISRRSIRFGRQRCLTLCPAANVIQRKLNPRYIVFVTGDWIFIRTSISGFLTGTADECLGIPTPKRLAKWIEAFDAGPKCKMQPIVFKLDIPKRMLK